jgi:signal transduction histidine kinase
MNAAPVPGLAQTAIGAACSIGWLSGCAHRLGRIALALLLLLVAFGASAAPDQTAHAPQMPARVLVLLPTATPLPALQEIVGGLRNTISTNLGRPIDLHIESADFADFEADHHDRVLARYLADKYQDPEQGHAPDVVVAVWGASYAFLRRHRDSLFSSTPLIFAGLDARELDTIGAAPRSTGVILELEMLATVNAALNLYPQAERLLVVSGPSPPERFVLEAVSSDLEELHGRLEVDYLIGESPSRVREILSTLPAGTLVFYAQILTDQSGGKHIPAEVLEMIAPGATAPVLGVVETYLGRGILGGYLMAPSRVGQAAGNLVVRLLKGESPEDIAPVIASSFWAFDARELTRWRLSETDLPPGSEIRFRPPTLWTEYRLVVVGGLVLIGLQALLIGLLVHQRAIRRDSELRALALGRRLINAHEHERAELARELHDNFQQQLGALAMMVGVNGSGDPDWIRNRLVCIGREMRAYAQRLHPPQLDDLGLADALRGECDRFAEAQGIPVRLFVDPSFAEPHPAQGLVLYRIVQEALQNVAKHAYAESVTIALQASPMHLKLSIRDDGKGFDPVRQRLLVSLGLYSMRQRVQAIGGTLEIESAFGRGSAILVSVPLDRDNRS